MRSIILVIHLSLDGYVAGPKGELSYFSPSEENLAFVNTLTTDADTALFGRKSFELLNDYWPKKCNDREATQAEVAYSKWYNAAQKIIVSSKLSEDRASESIVIRKNPEAELLNIKQQSGKSILLFGSPSLSQSMMASNLIDEFRVFIHPVFFGRGLPLFSELPDKVGLKLIKTDLLATGEIAAHYIKAR